MFVGCDDDTQTNDDTSSASVIGEWERTYQIGDMNDIASLSLDENNIATATFSGETLSGTYSISNNIITVLDDECPGIEGNYNYSITATTLTFTLVDDECGDDNGRADFIANQSTASWTRVD